MSVVRAVLFDAYGTLFDVQSVSRAAERLFPGHGAAVSTLWRQKQVEYSLLRSAGHVYTDFSHVTADALSYTLAAILPGTAIPESKEQELMDEYKRLDAFDDVVPALAELRAMGVPLGVLSNGTQPMLDAAVASARLSGLLSHVISADDAAQFKPSAEVYALGTGRTGLAAPEVLFVSSNGWDVAGATWFGYTTFWVNRRDAPVEHLGALPRAVGRTLADVVQYVKQHHGK
eukprot:m51a1_g2230 putative haloacid dehalogenase (231) ;mRNA; f:244224-245027